MSTHEIMPAERLARLQRVYPGAISYGQVEGTRHLTLAEVRKMEKRGEIKALRRFARRNEITGQVTIPYVRYKTVEQVRKEQIIKVSAVTGAGIAAAYGVGWLLWESRWILLAAGVATALIVFLAWLAPHWSRGCAGIHCPGCQG